MSKDQVLALLPKLTRQELREVAAACESLIPAVSGRNPEYDELAQTIAWMCERLGMSKHFTVPKKEFIKHGKPVLKFMRTHFAEETKVKVVRLAVLQFLVVMLVEWLKKSQVPINARTITLNLDKIPERFQFSFPGYIECGLAFKVVQAMTRVKHE
jgi:hypothetical protein